MYNQIFEFLDYLYSRTRNRPQPTSSPCTTDEPTAPAMTSAEPISSSAFADTTISESPTTVESLPTPEITSTEANTSARTLVDFKIPASVEDVVVKKIKTLVLLHKDKIIKFGEGVIPAPVGVEIDPKTGELTVPVEIVPIGEVVLNPKIVDSLLINEGFIKIKLIAYNQGLEPCSDAKNCVVKEATIPIQSYHDIEGICPDDHVQEKVEIKSISVMGIPDDSVSNSSGRKVNLIIKIILEVNLTICREEIIPVLSCGY